MFNKKTIKNSDFQVPVAIDTLTNLLYKKAWKKNNIRIAKTYRNS